MEFLWLLFLSHARSSHFKRVQSVSVLVVFASSSSDVGGAGPGRQAEEVAGLLSTWALQRRH